ncbi:MAG: amidohydrolase family protein [Deltaproteobacteria bacterium]|nr:amidohydrolase family protein [Deltaproteobacteria bacterium]
MPIVKIHQPLAPDNDLNLTRRDLFVEGSKIVLKPSGPVEEIFDASGYIVLPGFVNAHLHSNEVFHKGLFDGLPLELWALLVYSSPKPVQLSKRQVYLRTALAAVEMLLSGTTTAIDHLYDPGLADGNLEMVIKAYEDAGLRTAICIGAADLGPGATFPEVAGLKKHLQTANHIRQTCEGYLRDYQGREMLKIGLGPTGPQRCSDELLSGFTELAEKYDTIIHTHLLETKYQAVRAGYNLAARLQRLSFSSPRVSFSHCVWNSAAENDLIASTGATVVHNPISNLKIGAGLAATGSFIAQGLNLALGTDGSACNDSLSLPEVMKTACLISQVNNGLPIRPGDAWRAATSGGARSAGLANLIGSLSPESYADLVFLPLDQPALTPLNNWLHQLVYCSPRVSHVMVNGRWSIKLGQPSRVDLAALLQEIQKEWPDIQARVLASLAEAQKLKSRVEPFYRAFIKSLPKPEARP